MATINPEVLRRSVTRDEIETYGVKNGYSGGIMRFTIAGVAGPGLNLPYNPPAYWSPGRDSTLKAAYRNGGQWGSAVNIAVTKVMVSGYELDGDVALRVRHAREMLGAGWIDLLTRLGRDYVTTDNGAFLEIVRATKAYGSKVLGFVALSSARCVRTGDPEIPVIYYDALGQYHEMKAYQVAEFSDMPDDDYYGVGLCATSRAWDSIYEDLAVSNYFKEKATGRRPTALYFLSGFAPNAVSDAMAVAQEDTNRKGAQSFMGAAVASNPNPTTPNLTTIPLMSLPDNFDQQQHEELTQIRYANALGIDPTDLNPRLIGNRALGAGSQAQTLDDKAKSKGLISLREKISEFFNDTARWHPLPGGVTFAWSERDLKDQQAQASVSQTRAATRKTQVESGEITTEQALQLAVDAGDVPESFIAIDQTQEESLTDEDKATEGIDQPNAEAVEVESEPIVEPTTTQATDAGVRLAEFKEHDGAMIALYPSDEDSSKIAAAVSAVDWPEGSTISALNELHLTLAYLGKAVDITDERKAEILNASAKLATNSLPDPRFNGIARFNGSDEDGDAIVVLLSEPKLNEFAMRARSIGDESDHPFLPHMTLAYIPKDAPTPTVKPMFENVHLDRLCVVFAGLKNEYRVGGGQLLPDISRPKADAQTVALKAVSASATTLAHIIPSPADEPEGRKEAAKYWREVTKGLDEIGRIWTIAARENAPQDEGETARSIQHQLTGRNGPSVTLKLLVGNKARPEVAIRATLYGRKGFGPKRAKALRFRVGDQTVYARKVRGAAANDWHSRSMKQIEPMMRAMEDRLASLNVNQIDVSDIAGAQYYRTAPPAPGGKSKRKKGKR